MKKITVKDLAEYSSRDINELIVELTDLVPDVNWRPSTPVPDDLAAKFMSANDEYKSSEPIAALAPTEGYELATARINREASQYALMEALDAVSLQEIITTAIADALTEIEVSEATKAQVWATHIQNKIGTKQTKLEANTKRIAETQARIFKGAQSSFTNAHATKTQAEENLKKTQAFLAQVLTSI